MQLPSAAMSASGAPSAAGRRRRHVWDDSSDEDEDARLRDDGGVLSGLTGDWSSAPPSPPSPSTLHPSVAYTSPHPPHLSLRVLLSPSRGLAFQLWPAALLLCRYLDSQPSPLPPASRVVELGAGCGLVGLLAASLGAHVTLTDLPAVLPHLLSNVAVNSPPFVQNPESAEGWRHPSGGTVQVAALGWGEGREAEAGVVGADMILLADCVYWEELFDPLLDTLTALCMGTTRVLLSQTTRRSHVEGRFFKRAKKRGLTVQRLDEWTERHTDGQVIHLYDMRRSSPPAALP